MLKKLSKLLKWLGDRFRPQPTTVINIHDVGGDVVINQHGKVKVVREDDNNKLS